MERSERKLRTREMNTRTEVVHKLHVFEVTSVRASHNDHHTYGVLVDVLHRIRGMHDEIRFGVYRNETSLDVPVSLESEMS